MFGNEGYTTPEGHWLPKRLLLPDARSFTDVLTYIGEWDTSWTMTVEGQRVAPRPVLVEGNEVGPFCTTRNFPRRHRSLAVHPTEAVVAALAERVVTSDDHMHFELVLHPHHDRALVIASHGHIIGDHWLAYIDPSTIPDPPEKQ